MLRTFLLATLALVLLPSLAEAQFSPTFAAGDTDELAVGVQAYAGSRSNCDANCAAVTAGIYVKRANGQSLGVDADWLDLSNITISYGFPTGEITTFLAASFGRLVYETVYEGTGYDDDHIATQASNRLVTTAIGVGIGWRFARLRVSHDGEDALWQAGVAYSPGVLR